MNVAELQPRQGKVDIVLEVIKKEETREFNKFGKAGQVCNATGKDETGEITLTLWNEQVEQVNVGDKIKVTNGYVSEWQGEKQLSTGKFGQLEVVGKAEEAPAEEAPAETPAEPAQSEPESAQPESAEEPAVEETVVEEEKVE